jgi:hypothetical protein
VLVVGGGEDPVEDGGITVDMTCVSVRAGAEAGAVVGLVGVVEAAVANVVVSLDGVVDAVVEVIWEEGVLLRCSAFLAFPVAAGGVVFGSAEAGCVARVGA